MNIFKNMNDLVARWQVVEKRKFNADELSVCVDNIVVSSEFGKSIRFTHPDGTCTNIPLVPSSNVAVGTKVNLEDCEIITLELEGTEDRITRINI